MGRRILTTSLVALCVSRAATLNVHAQNTPMPPAAQVAPATPTASDVAPASNARTTPIEENRVDAMPVNLDRVQREIRREPLLKIENDQLKYYVLVLARQPKFMDFIGSYDLQNGPTRSGPAMTHQEFLNMVTPKELNELFGINSSTTFAMFQAYLSNAIGHALVNKTAGAIRSAHASHELSGIRDRIDEELKALDSKDSSQDSGASQDPAGKDPKAPQDPR